MPRADRPRRQPESGSLHSGYVTVPAEADEGAFVVAALERASTAGKPVVEDTTDADGELVLVAARPVAGGGYAFAFQRVAAGRETRGLRVVVVALGLLTFALVVASLRTLTVVEWDVSNSPHPAGRPRQGSPAPAWRA